MSRDSRAGEWDRIQAEENQLAQRPRGDAAANRAEAVEAERRGDHREAINRARAAEQQQEQADRHQRAADNAASEAAKIREGKR